MLIKDGLLDAGIVLSFNMLPVSSSSTDFSHHLKNMLSGTCLKSNSVYF